jgi:alkylhydroperoxidase family enzyme
MASGSRYASELARLREAVLDGPAETAAGLRRAAAARSGELAFGRAETRVPEDLAPYLDKVALHAYKVVDDDIDALRGRGYSEDALFELTVAAAVGAGLARLETGLRAIGSGG